MKTTTGKGQERVALVTGGASGIGRAVCRQLAAEGAVVLVADINAAGAEEVAAGIRQQGDQAEALHLDVSRAESVNQAVAEAITTHGRLDYMFNNAAVAAVGELRDGNIDEFRRVVEVNLFGVVHGTLAAYRVMLRQKSGHIVNVASLTGLMPTPILTAYSTTKWAIVGFSTAVRLEAAELGVRVSVACPGLVRTDLGEHNAYWNVRKEDHLAQLPWRWMIEPDSAARAILRGMARNQEIIVFPFSARVAWWMYRVYPALFVPLLRRMLRRYRSLRIRP